MSSITSLLADNYAGIPKSEYLKRLEYAAQPASGGSQSAPAASAITSTSAVKLDLSPEAQRIMAGASNMQEPPPLPADIKNNVGAFFKEISNRIGFNVDSTSDQRIYTVDGQKTTVWRSTIKYFYEHPEEANNFIDQAQILETQVRAYPAGHNIERTQQRDNMLGLLSSVSGAAKYSLRDLGLMAQDANQPIKFAEGNQPSSEAVQQGVLSYMEAKYGIALDESFHGQLKIGSAELQSINGVKTRTYTDTTMEQALNAINEVKGYYDNISARKGHFMTVAGGNLHISHSSIMDQKPLSLAPLDVEEGLSTMASMIGSQVTNSRSRAQETLTILAKDAQHNGRLDTINQVMKHYLSDMVPDFDLNTFLES